MKKSKDNIIFSLNYIYNKNFLKKLGIGDWGLGIGDWGLGIGANPQSPIPNPHLIKYNFYFQEILIIKLLILQLNILLTS